MLQSANTRFPIKGMLFLAAIAMLLYGAAIIAFSVNVPVGDDYSMLGFINEFQSASGTANKLQLLFSLHNEHRIVITRAIMLLCAEISGSLDFRALNVIGNSALLLTLFVIGRMLRLGDDSLKWALLFLIALLPQTLKLMFYPMAGVQAYFGLLFSFLYLHFSLKDSKWWYSTLLFYLLAVLTTGSGIFLVIIGVPLLLYKRCYLRSAIHVAVSILVVLLYAPGSSSMPYLLEHPLTVARFFLLLLGNIAQLPMMGSAYLQICFSIALLGYFAYFIWESFFRAPSGYKDESLVKLCCLLYLLMIISLIAIGRASIYERDLWGASLDGRYRIYSILFVALCCMDLVGRLRDRGKVSVRITNVLVAFALLFNLVWFAPAIIQMRFDSEGREKAMKQWLDTGDISNLPVWSTPPEEARVNLEAAIRTGVYRPEH